MAEYQYKDASQLVSIIETQIGRGNLIEGEYNEEDDTEGLSYYDGEIVGTGLIKNSVPRAEGITPQFTADEVLNLMDKTLEKEENVDYKLRQRPSTDYNFLIQTVINKGNKT